MVLCQIPTISHPTRGWGEWGMPLIGALLANSLDSRPLATCIMGLASALQEAFGCTIKIMQGIHGSEFIISFYQG